MKVLIVSENEKTISCLKTFFKAQDGYEVITYRIPLKALDNFGEIAPNLVIYNAVDFPRHWKIFLQYVKSMHDMAIYDSVLIVDKKFDASEKEKSQALGVWKLLSESKLYKYADSAAAETVQFTDIITNIATDETEYDVTPELEEKFEVHFDETMTEIDDVIFAEPAAAIEEGAAAVADEQAADDEPTTKSENQTEKIIDQPPAKAEPSATVIFNPVDGEDTLEQALREQDMLMMSIQMDKPQPPAPTVDKQEEEGFTLSDADIALLKSLEPEKVNPREVQFLFRHPQTGALVTGIVETVTGNTVVFRPDNPLISTTFSMGQYIDSASYKNGDSVSLVGAYAVPYDDTIHLTLEGPAAV